MTSYSFRETRPGEWVCDDVGLVVKTIDGRWFAYPFGVPSYFGPFSAFDLARRALLDHVVRDASG